MRQTALFEAFGRYYVNPLISITDNFEVIKTIVENGANVNFENCLFAKDSVLDIAYIHNSKEVVKFLIDKGADFNRTKKMGKTDFTII